MSIIDSWGSEESVNNIASIQPMKRKFLVILASLPLFTSCDAKPDEIIRQTYQNWLTGEFSKMNPQDRKLAARFKDIDRITLNIGVVPGVVLYDVKMLEDQKDIPFYYKSVMHGDSAGLVLSSGKVPLRLRVVWRGEPDVSENGRVYKEGPILGDFIVPVGARIPNEVIEDVYTRDGNLNLWLRLQPDRVLFGWGVRGKPVPGPEQFEPQETQRENLFMVGGDFQPAYVNHLDGEVLRKGWHIDKEGRRVLTDY